MTHSFSVMFVDDEPAVLQSLGRAFRHWRGEIDLQFETDPTAALAKATALRPDVVVSDMMMPQMTGLELVIAMREQLPETKFIMLTGMADLPTAMNAINQASVFRFYTKPCDTAMLEEGIRAALPAGKPQAVEAPGPSVATGLSERIGLATLDHLALGVIVVDAGARVLLANNAGANLFAQKDGLLTGAHEVCRAANSRECQELHGLIKAAASADEVGLKEGTIALTRPSLRRPLCVAVTPLPQDQGHDQGLAILFVSDPEDQKLPSDVAIARLFGLTGSESRLVRALTEGARLEDAASQTGVTHSTARTYLKQIFAKTGTNRQSDLIRLVLTSPNVSAVPQVSEEPRHRSEA